MIACKLTQITANPARWFIALMSLLFVAEAIGQNPTHRFRFAPLDPIDSMRQAIRVPEIDPRQYIIIYEWEPSNADKVRRAIPVNDHRQYRDRYIETYERILEELKVNKQGLEMDTSDLKVQLASAIGKKDTTIITQKIKRIITNIKQLDSEMQEYEDFIKYNRRVVNDIESDSIYRRHLQKNRKKKYNPEKNLKKRHKPIDYYDLMGDTYAWTQESYAEYYNEIFWRNAGSPDWTPIWWLNHYPWPNSDYRNIDLEDRDYRDQHFALIPYQKYSVVDDKAVLRIVFDKDQLAQNESFRGQVSLSAVLYGGDGDSKEDADPRPIEVDPYSVIGEEEEVITLSNAAAGELVDVLLVMTLEAAKLRRSLSTVSLPVDSLLLSSNDISQPSELGENVNDVLNKKLTEIQTQIQNQDSISGSDSVKVLNTLRSVCEISYSVDEFTIVDQNDTLTTYCFLDLLGLGASMELDVLRRHVDDVIEQYSSRSAQATGTVEPDSKKYSQALKAIKDQVEGGRRYKDELVLVKNYIQYIEEIAGNSRGAFLNLIGREKIFFTDISRRLKKSIDVLSGMEDSLYVAVQSLDNATFSEDLEISAYRDLVNIAARYNASIDPVVRSLDDLTVVQGSPLASAIRKISSISIGDNFDTYNQRLLERLERIFNNAERRVQLRSYLAAKAGELLYQDMIYGTIDLDLADANDGDVLSIQMVWNKNGKQDTLNSDTTASDGVALYVAKFYVRNRGWRLEQHTNAVLIDRIKEDLLPLNYPLSPSNFTPTAGLALSWTLRDDLRIIKKYRFDKGTNEPLFDKWGRVKYNRFGVFAQRFVKWLEPSISFQLNYLHFNQLEDFELGIGPAFGVFNNSVFVGGGVNLMEFSNRPLYVSFGLDAVRLGKKIQEQLIQKR